MGTVSLTVLILVAHIRKWRVLERFPQFIDEQSCDFPSRERSLGQLGYQLYHPFHLVVARGISFEQVLIDPFVIP